ncbi:hypothetical protein CROQUDRAFT_656185 [Cronartium quercuum f. sp. fusiforme G11]|uniref:WD40 repeat-like protein n=1 Tax=Cronartium quercuum f. sp. fusiforme G11 TaxID=708437 RepID=A0A9P6NNL8_9BASI|nr:hypothetical protein CROQUDRAFT_656185 [Cronartium quercuum f. sp. fusiforme G11]
MSHFSIQLGSPIYCAVFIQKDRLILGGGGGSSKSGVGNKLWLIRLEPERKQHVILYEHSLPRDSDAPMSLDLDPTSGLLLTGINSSPTDLKAGRNDHFRTFTVKESTLDPKDACQILDFKTEEDYQRIVCLSRTTPRLLAVGGSNNQLKLLSYPSLKSATTSPIDCPPGELLSADFSEDGKQFLVCTSKAVRLFSITRSSKSKGPKTVKLAQEQEFVPPTDRFPTSFRSARFGSGPTSESVLTVLNPHDRKRGARVLSWNATSGVLQRSRAVSGRPVTAFDVSNSGALAAVGTSDLAVSIIDAVSLRPILSILHAHEFPVTSLKFSNDSSRLISASADTTMRVIEVPERRSPWRSSASMLVLLTIIVLTISLLVSKRSIEVDQLLEIIYHSLSPFSKL